MRRRFRSRVLTSARTAARTFDLQLAIANPSDYPPQLYVEIGTNPNASGSAWRQQGGPFCGSRPRRRTISQLVGWLILQPNFNHQRP
jgi:hypothetical protein